MQIDRAKALRVLEAEAGGQASAPRDWEELLVALSRECERGANKTFIAMIGTALLAKSTNPGADPFALKSGLGTPGAYSARGLCQHVLAAHAPRLGIDLGVRRREPLNNQPFFAEDRVHLELPIKPIARAGFDLLWQALQKVAEMTSAEEARAALRAFLRVRAKERYQGQLDLQARTGMAVSDLLAAIKSFVSQRSEYGRRAEAVVAGLLEIVAPGRVIASQAHDPDRHYPGDVNVVDDGRMTHAFEVRDKVVRESNSTDFVNKVASAGCGRAGIVAVAPQQASLALAETEAFAERRGVVLAVFIDWQSFLRAVAFWSGSVPSFAINDAFRAIHRRALELEVSEEALRLWESFGRQRD